MPSIRKLIPLEERVDKLDGGRGFREQKQPAEQQSDQHNGEEPELFTDSQEVPQLAQQPHFNSVTQAPVGLLERLDHVNLFRYRLPIGIFSAPELQRCLARYPKRNRHGSNHQPEQERHHDRIRHPADLALKVTPPSPDRRKQPRADDRHGNREETQNQQRNPRWAAPQQPQA
jgi:hypothetical protein